jgi:deoxyribodipyrimidine photo-lyase
MTQILWLRHDLRLHDNEGFRLALANKSALGPLSVIFILPDTWLKKDARKMTRLATAKANFLRAALIDIHRQLEDQTISFHMYAGDPVEIFTQLFYELKDSNIHLLTSHPQAPEERDTLRTIQNLSTPTPSTVISVTTYDAQTLFSSEQCVDLLTDFPSTFTAFRKRVESAPAQWQVISSNETPPLTLHEQPLRLTAPIAWPHQEHCPPLVLSGGERGGKQWLKHYLWEQRAISHYKRSRNDLIDRPMEHASSSHLSAYLAWGCLSARYVWHEILQYEAVYGSDEHSYWLKFELLWREYFHWSLRSSMINPKHDFGAALFSEGGLQSKTRGSQFNEELWQAWCHATTGVPMIDAGLRELQQTGFVSNRLRQNMASYFIHQLKLDWRLGARWFEMHLIDFDVASNYGNWAYIAGVGHDARPQRQFDLNKQLHQYDPELTHIRQWCPELTPYNLEAILAHQAGINLLTTYPVPKVPVFNGGD